MLTYQKNWHLRNAAVRTWNLASSVLFIRPHNTFSSAKNNLMHFVLPLLDTFCSGYRISLFFCSYSLFIRLNNKLPFTVWNKHLFIYDMTTAFSFTLLDSALSVVSRNSSLVCHLTSNRFVTVSKWIIRFCDWSKKICIPFSQVEIPHQFVQFIVHIPGISSVVTSESSFEMSHKETLSCHECR